MTGYQQRLCCGLSEHLMWNFSVDINHLVNWQAKLYDGHYHNIANFVVFLELLSAWLLSAPLPQ